MSAMFTTIVIFTIGALCSPIGAKMPALPVPVGPLTIQAEKETTPSSTVVEIPGYSREEGRCSEMMKCDLENWDSSQNRMKTDIWTRVVCTLQDCYNLCHEKSTSCKAFEFYKIQDESMYYCTVFPENPYYATCEDKLMNDSTPGTPIITYRKTDKPTHNSTSFSPRTPRNCGSKNLTSDQVIKHAPMKYRCCRALLWIFEASKNINNNRINVQQGIQLPNVSINKSVSESSIIPPRSETPFDISNLRSSKDINNNRPSVQHGILLLNDHLPDPAESIECKKNLDDEKEKHLQSFLRQFRKKAEALCLALASRCNGTIG